MRNKLESYKMKIQFLIYLSGLVLLINSCRHAVPSADAESWEGTFATKKDGVQSISVFFSFKDGNGVFNMPNLIPIPLDLYELKKEDDSVSFKVDFRSGTIISMGRYVHADTIKGLSVRQNGEKLPFLLYKSAKSNSIFNLPKPEASETYTINLKHNSEKEKVSKALLEKVIANYKVEKFIYTKNVMLDDSTIPHSHPVLTINTSDTTEENMISTFLHEQMHWFILSKNEQNKKVVEIFKKEFPGAPVNFPDGSGDAQSTYEHLTVCYYEYQALKELCGQEKADKVMDYLKNRLYKWIYKTMLENETKIKGILEENKLTL